MLNRDKVYPVLEKYKAYFPDHWENEKYKWEAIQYFHEHWNFDAPNFGKMFYEATEKTHNLLVTGHFTPRVMILNFAREEDDTVRQMFRDLYDESQDLAERIKTFQEVAESIRKKHSKGRWKRHYQSTNAISTYLWLMYPDKYYIYKYGAYMTVASEFESDYHPKHNGEISHLTEGYKFYDEIRSIVREDKEIAKMVNAAIDENCYPDPQMRTLTYDFGYYIDTVYSREKDRDPDTDTPEETLALALTLDEYNPGISEERWAELLKDPSVFSADALQIMKRMKDYDGPVSFKQLADTYGESTEFYMTGSEALADRVRKVTGCKLPRSGSKKRKRWKILYLGESVKTNEDGQMLWKLQNELDKALDIADLSEVSLFSDGFKPDNGIMEQQNESQYWMLVECPRVKRYQSMCFLEVFNDLYSTQNGKQSPVLWNIKEVQPGDYVVFYIDYPIDAIIALGEIRQNSNDNSLWYTMTNELSDPIPYDEVRKRITHDISEVAVWYNGKLLKLTKEDFAVVTGIICKTNEWDSPEVVKYSKADFLDEIFMTEERFDCLESLVKRKKNIILKGAPGVGKTFAGRKLAYAMMGGQDDSRIEFIQFHPNYSYEDFIMGYRPSGEGFTLTPGCFYRFCQKAAYNPDKEYFFLIDEINRGNMSKIFGELMMLIEKEYRGMEVTLPYDGTPFSVPENLYIIGMMNTADRSLAIMDYALKRRFSFFPMEPGFGTEGFQKYLKSFSSDRFNALIEQIQVLNREISEDPSLGSGFRIGHSYFCNREKKDFSVEWLRSVLEFDILPLLEEYWFDEPEKRQRWEMNLRGALDDK